jgi:hypothetical protein
MYQLMAFHVLQELMVVIGMNMTVMAPSGQK